MASGNPAQGMDIAQAARCRFDVRLKIVCGVMVSGVTTSLFLNFRFVKGFTWPERFGMNFQF
jgi:hypothetical protein